MNDLDLHLTYCSNSNDLEIVPVPTCCKLHAHNYTCIPKNLGRWGTLDPSCQLVNIKFKLILVHAKCFFSFFVYFHLKKGALFY